MILSTARLDLREMTEEDLTPLAAILSDEVAMAAYEGAFSPDEIEDVRRTFVTHYRSVDMPHLAFAISRTSWEGHVAAGS